jgi:multidrug transporter EmrE-like cation transporter
MIPKTLFLYLVGAAVAFEAVADILLKKWALGSKQLFLVIGLVLYFIGTIFWAISLKHEFLSKAISIFTIINLIAIILVGIFFFNEELSSINKIGIALGVLSVILIEL